MENNAPIVLTPPVKVVSSAPNELDSHGTLVILLLVSFFPIGVILMWMWMPWPKWLKLTLTLPFIISIVFLLLAISLIALIPKPPFPSTLQNQYLPGNSLYPTSEVSPYQQ